MGYAIFVRFYKKQDLDLLAVAYSAKHFRKTATQILRDFANGVSYQLNYGGLSEYDRLPPSKQICFTFPEDDAFVELYKKVPERQKGYFVKNIIRRYLNINTLYPYCGVNFESLQEKTEELPVTQKKPKKAKETVVREKQEDLPEIVTENPSKPPQAIAVPTPAKVEEIVDDSIDMFAALRNMMEEY